ncbi:MAG: hypothetical protein ACI805_000015 [Candidatus Azotimanducaceae bacterium]|jgi:hypothetical protein
MTLTSAKPMHVLQIVMKNTSTLDYSLPVLWGIRQKYPTAKISILYTTLNKKQILRDSIFLEEFCCENDIQQYDYSSFIVGVPAVFKALILRFFERSYSDKLSLVELRRDKFRNFGKVLKSVLVRYMKPVELRISALLVRAKRILPSLAPDIILFDNRTVTDCYGRDELYRYFEKERKPVILLPHAPHYIHATDEFCRFDEHNSNLMPSYTEHWMPFKFGTPWEVAMEHKTQFIKIGYPSLDSRWWNHIRQDADDRDGITCLVMTRKCLPEGKVRPQGYDHFTLDYEEVVRFYRMLKNVVDKLSYSVNIVIKPHPSSSEPENRKILDQVGLTGYAITYESFYELLPRVDMVVSQFTTSLAMPIAYNIPTMVVAAELQQFVHRQWPVLEKYYQGLKYFTNEADFEDKLAEMFTTIHEPQKKMADYEHLRQFFEDRAIDTAIDRIDKIMAKKS